MDIVAIIAAIASILTVLYNLSKLREERAKLASETERARAETEKIRAEYKGTAKQTDLDRALKMIDQLQEDNERLRARLRDYEEKSDERERELSCLRVGVLILIDQLEQMGVSPRWSPSGIVKALQE